LWRSRWLVFAGIVGETLKNSGILLGRRYFWGVFLKTLFVFLGNSDLNHKNFEMFLILKGVGCVFCFAFQEFKVEIYRLKQKHIILSSYTEYIG
jgi:hypothetical protein